MTNFVHSLAISGDFGHKNTDLVELHKTHLLMLLTLVKTHSKTLYSGFK